MAVESLYPHPSMAQHLSSNAVDFDVTGNSNSIAHVRFIAGNAEPVCLVLPETADCPTGFHQLGCPRGPARGPPRRCLNSKNGCQNRF